MKPTFVAIIFTAFATIANVCAFGCKPDEVKGWMASCDSLVDISQIRCDDRACHTALHRLVEQETLDCYAESALGPASDLAKYKSLDAFCHGEGPDPTELSTASSSVASQQTNATGSGLLTGNTTVVMNDTSTSVPAITSITVPSPSPSSAASSSVVSIASTTAITLSLIAATL